MAKVGFRPHRRRPVSRSLRRIVPVSLYLIFAAGAALATGMTENRGNPAGDSATVPQPGVVLRVATLRGPTGAGMARLMTSGTVIAPGVDATYEIVGTPDLMVARVLSGQVDLASLPVNLAAKLYNSGVPYRMAALNVLGVLYLVSTGPDVQSIQDLRGKTIYCIGKGSTPEYVVRYLLASAGLVPDKDVFLDFHYEQVELAQLVAAKKVALAVLPEPFVSLAEAAQPAAHVVVDINRAWANFVPGDVPLALGCLIASDQIVRRSPAALSAFLDAYRRSVEWENANPTPAAAVIGSADLGIPAAVAERAIPRMSMIYRDASSARTAVESFLSVLLKYAPESIGGHLPDAAFYLPVSK